MQNPPALLDIRILRTRRPMAERKKSQEAAATAARNLGPEIELLRSFGVPASRIAKLLDESHANIRQISRRAQFPEEVPLEVPAPPLKEPHLEEFLLYGRRRKAVEEFEGRVEEIFNSYASRYQFAEGARVLSGLLQLV